MVTLSSSLIWQIISFILPSNEHGCVFACTTLESGPSIDLKKMAILAKKIIFSDEAHFGLGGYVNKQNYRIWGKENPLAYIENPTLPKRDTICCGFWSRDIIFFRKWIRKGRYSQWRSLSGHFVRIFFHKNWRGEYGQHLVSAPYFWRSHYQP